LLIRGQERKVKGEDEELGGKQKVFYVRRIDLGERGGG